MCLFIYLFGVLHRFQHCTGHITTGSWKGRGNQYIQFVRVLYCKLSTNGKQLPAFPLEAVPGIEPQPQRWEARVLPLCHCGPRDPDVMLPQRRINFLSIVSKFNNPGIKNLLNSSPDLEVLHLNVLNIFLPNIMPALTGKPIHILNIDRFQNRFHSDIIFLTHPTSLHPYKKCPLQCIRQ